MFGRPSGLIVYLEFYFCKNPRTMRIQSDIWTNSIDYYGAFWNWDGVKCRFPRVSYHEFIARPVIRLYNEPSSSLVNSFLFEPSYISLLITIFSLLHYRAKPVYTTGQSYLCSTTLTMPSSESNEAPSARILREFGKENATLEQRLGVLVRANRHPEIYHLSSLQLREIRETIKQYERLLVNPWCLL